MELLQWFGAWPGAVWLQGSGTAYLFVNAMHILGIGLLVGGILPLDLRLLGIVGRIVPLGVLAPFLSRVAASGLALAVGTGLWLFSVKPVEYAGNGAFLCKVALLVLALANIVAQHRSQHFAGAVAGGDLHPLVRLLALCSLLIWLSVLVAGRWIGFV